PPIVLDPPARTDRSTGVAEACASGPTVTDPDWTVPADPFDELPPPIWAVPIEPSAELLPPPMPLEPPVETVPTLSTPAADVGDADTEPIWAVPSEPFAELSPPPTAVPPPSCAEDRVCSLEADARGAAVTEPTWAVPIEFVAVFPLPACV